MPEESVGILFQSNQAITKDPAPPPAESFQIVLYAPDPPQPLISNSSCIGTTPLAKDPLYKILFGEVLSV
ncbi:hypothetical protein [Intestinibacter sp.]|uniref:hypothetical protein n=1 Tax=Intestinibacter sp. TaxID=1965304 RepID=UPI002A76606F|nr:hypothetical protein [Intestinibacter sp.]MDY2735898.1 hypothetical protein [Intestinibacter sp.]